MNLKREKERERGGSEIHTMINSHLYFIFVFYNISSVSFRLLFIS